MCSPLQRLKHGPLVMFDLVLTISNSHFLPVSVTSSSTMVKLQPLLCLYPPSSPRSLWTSLSNFMMLEGILLYRMPIQSLFSLSLSLSLSLSVSGLDLLPGSCPLPCTWQNASPVWIIYIFLWSCQKSGITSFYIRIWPWKGASRVTVRCNDTPSTIFKFFHGFHFIYFYHKV